MPKYTSTKQYFGKDSNLYEPGEVFELAESIRPSKCMTRVTEEKTLTLKGKKSKEGTLSELTDISVGQMKVKGGDGTEVV